MPNRSFLPNKEDSRKVGIAIGIGALCSAFIEFFSPTTIAPTGRWSWVISPIYENLGSPGLIALWTFIGLVLIAGGVKNDD